MCQCTLRLISMYELTLFFEVCVSVLSTSFKLVWIGRHMLKNHFAKCQCNFRLPLKLKFLNTWCTSTCISIPYFTNRGNNHISQNQNQANAIVMQKKTFSVQRKYCLIAQGLWILLSGWWILFLTCPTASEVFWGIWRTEELWNQFC